MGLQATQKWLRLAWSRTCLSQPLERRRDAKALRPQKGKDRREQHGHYGFQLTVLSFLLLI